MDLVLLTYKLTKTFPSEEMYALISQMRRAAVSIPSNIAEGRRRHTGAGFKQFLRIAFGSAAELETQVEIARRLGYGNPSLFQEIKQSLTEVMKMLNVMCK